MFTLLSEAIGKVLLLGLALGAGVPALFAAGIKAYAYGTGEDPAHGERPHLLGRLLGILCFALVVGVVLVGILVIVASGLHKTVSFEHVFPVLKDK